MPSFFMFEIMQYLYLTLLFLGFLFSMYYLLRDFYKKLSDQYNDQNSLIQDQLQGIKMTFQELKKVNENVAKLVTIIHQFYIPPDKPAPNTVAEKEKTIDFYEQDYMTVPKDIKFEIEGGDSQVPSGYKEQ